MAALFSSYRLLNLNVVPIMIKRVVEKILVLHVVKSIIKMSTIWWVQEFVLPLTFLASAPSPLYLLFAYRNTHNKETETVPSGI